MGKSSILILGAGLMQKPAILSAKELGLKVFVIDADDKAVCVKKADVFKQIDLKDKEGILEYATELKAKENLACVFTAGTDFSASVSYVSQKLGFASHSYEAALNASIKTQMRECFEKFNVPSPAFVRVEEKDIGPFLLKKIREKMDFPLVVKPVDNMGARGCRMVRSIIEFDPAIKAAVQASRTGVAIVEEYMEGPEYSIDALIYNNTMTITGFAERHICYPPYFIEVGHTMPAILEKDVHDQLISVFALGAKALGLTCGAAKADIKFTSKGPMIGEIAARLSGGYMSGWTYPYASDFNLTKQAIVIACGQEPTDLFLKRKPVPYTPSELCKDSEEPYKLFEIECTRTSAERAWMSIPGTVEYIENIEDFTDKAVFDFLPRATVNLGRDVDFPRNNVEKCGNIIAVSHNRDIAIKAAENAVSNVFITLSPNNDRTERFLANNSLQDEKEFPPSAYGELSLKDFSSIFGVLEKDASALKNIPEFLKSADYINKVDWNYNTITQTAEKFDILRPKHPAIDARKFWRAVIRGGLQAAVYVSDSTRG